MGRGQLPGSYFHTLSASLDEAACLFRPRLFHWKGFSTDYSFLAGGLPVTEEAAKDPARSEGSVTRRYSSCSLLENCIYYYLMSKE